MKIFKQVTFIGCSIPVLHIQLKPCSGQRGHPHPCKAARPWISTPCLHRIDTTLSLLLRPFPVFPSFFSSPLVRKSQAVLDSGLLAVDSRFQVLDSSLIRFQIPIVNGIPDSLSLIRDSKVQDSWFHNLNFLDSGLHKQKFPEFRNPFMGRFHHLAGKSGNAFDAKRKQLRGRWP